MTQKVLVECQFCCWSKVVEIHNFQNRCPNGHKIEEVTPVTRL